MRRRPVARRRVATAVPVAIALALAVALTLLAGPAPAGAEETTTTQPLPPPAAYIVVDAGTGAVLAAKDERVPLPPASTTKILTALVVRDRLRDDQAISISRDAEARPARKLDIKAGQVWRVGDLLRAMLLCSCNDTAWALAEAAGASTKAGGIAGFGDLLEAKARQLGMRDRPVLQDPSGLDDEFSVSGGNLISARDLAIAARALLADDELSAIVRLPEYRWKGPDGVEHVVDNHNRLFDSYTGAIGIKTGYTDKARATFVGAATRGDRTILTVLLGSPDIWAQSPKLLDRGFLTPAAEDRSFPHLPALDGTPVPDPTTTSTAARRSTTRPATTTEPATTGPTTERATTDAGGPDEQAAGAPVSSSGGGGVPPGLVAAGVVLLALVLAVAARRRQVVVRRRRRRAEARARAADRVASPG